MIILVSLLLFHNGQGLVLWCTSLLYYPITGNNRCYGQWAISYMLLLEVSEMHMILNCFSNGSSVVVLFFSFLCSSGSSFHFSMFADMLLLFYQIWNCYRWHQVISQFYSGGLICVDKSSVLMKIFPVTRLKQKFKIKSLLQPWLIFKHLENRISYDVGAGSVLTWDFVQCR